MEMGVLGGCNTRATVDISNISTIRALKKRTAVLVCLTDRGIGPACTSSANPERRHSAKESDELLGFSAQFWGVLPRTRVCP